MKEYNEQVVETLDDAGCIIANKNIIIDNLQARIAELEGDVAIERASRKYWEDAYAEWINTDKAAQGLIAKDARIAELKAENELLKGRKNVELAANTDNAKSKQQRELAGPMKMGQLLAGSTHKTSGDLEIERTKPVTWIHKGGGFISDSRGKFIGCFSGDFRYRDRIICAVNSESEASKQLVAAQEENGRLENQVLARDAELWGRTQEILGLREQLAAEQRVAEWQPISTAPKDEAVFLAWRKHATHPLMVRYEPSYDWFANYDGEHVYDLTHWMPLPKPPAMAKGEQG